MTRSAILVVGVGVVLALRLLWRALQRRFDPFEPIVAFCAAWGAMFVARLPATLIEGDTKYFGIDVLGTLPLVLLLALVGAVAFICSYELSLGGRLARSRPPLPTLNETRAGWAALAVAAASAVALVLAVATTVGLNDLDVLLEGRGEGLGAVLSGSSDYLWNASLLAIPAGIVLVAVALRRRTVPFVLAAVACCGLVLLRTIPAGNRIALLPFLLGVAMVVYLYAQLVFAGSFWLVIVGLRDGPGDTVVLGAFLCLPLFAMLVFASRRSQLPRGRTPGTTSFLTTKTGRAG